MRNGMAKFICEACGMQYGDMAEPPAHCAICEDERQYVAWSGQQWTTMEALAADHRGRIEDAHGVLAIGQTPAFAIDHRAFFLPTDAGNILWEVPGFVSDEAIAAIRERGGLQRIIISHPHFYASMGDWSDALGGVRASSP